MEDIQLQFRKPRDWCNPTSVPLFWSETKPVKLWEGLLANYQVSLVVDLTPSVPLASACLRKGVRYCGISLSSEHAQWACNVLNKEAVSVICDTQHPLHSAPLSELLKKHFQDLLETAPVEDGDPAPATPPL